MAMFYIVNNQKLKLVLLLVNEILNLDLNSTNTLVLLKNQTNERIFLNKAKNMRNIKKNHTENSNFIFIVLKIVCNASIKLFCE